MKTGIIGLPQVGKTSLFNMLTKTHHMGSSGLWRDIRSDLERHFIRAEVIRWDALLEAGSEAKARAKGTLRLEGKDYLMQDGDVMHIRHSG